MSDTVLRATFILQQCFATCLCRPNHIFQCAGKSQRGRFEKSWMLGSHMPMSKIRWATWKHWRMNCCPILGLQTLSQFGALEPHTVPPATSPKAARSFKTNIFISSSYPLQTANPYQFKLRSLIPVTNLSASNTTTICLIPFIPQSDVSDHNSCRDLATTAFLFWLIAHNITASEWLNEAMALPSSLMTLAAQISTWVGSDMLSTEATMASVTTFLGVRSFRKV